MLIEKKVEDSLRGWDLLIFMSVFGRNFEKMLKNSSVFLQEMTHIPAVFPK